jgi:nucleoside-diphosphate-sugar epimerase
MQPTLAITGASGFLGRHLVAECLRRELGPVRVLSRDRKAFADVVHPALVVCEGDLASRQQVEKFLVPNATVIHLAYLRGTREANMAAAANLAAAARNSAVAKVVHCSTAVVVGFKAAGVITESTPPEPRPGYQATKLEIESVLRAELPPSVPLAILRPTEIVGPGGSSLRQMIRRVESKRNLENAVRRFVLRARHFNCVSVHNVVQALLLLAASPARSPCEVYNVADDEDPDNNYGSIEEIIASALGVGRPRLNFGLPLSCLSPLFKLLPGHSPPDRVYSSAKLEGLGFHRVAALRRTVQELVAWHTARTRAAL